MAQINGANAATNGLSGSRSSHAAEIASRHTGREQRDGAFPAPLGKPGIVALSGEKSAGPHVALRVFFAIQADLVSRLYQALSAYRAWNSTT